MSVTAVKLLVVRGTVRVIGRVEYNIPSWRVRRERRRMMLGDRGGLKDAASWMRKKANGHRSSVVCADRILWKLSIERRRRRRRRRKWMRRWRRMRI